MGDPDRLQVECKPRDRRQPKTGRFTFGELGHQRGVERHIIGAWHSQHAAVRRAFIVADRLEQACDRGPCRRRRREQPVVEGQAGLTSAREKPPARDLDKLDHLTIIAGFRLEPDLGTAHQPAPCLGCRIPAL